MKLAEALRLTNLRTRRIAFVGAGGKTTAMFRLARELAPALVTTSTHLGTWQAGAADRHFTWLEGLPLPDIEPWLGEGVTLITGGPAGDDRLQGLTASQLAKIDTLAGYHDLPVLIEADGARQRPLKAPAAYEPVIPVWADLVVVVAGLSGLGKPLTTEWVHRPERFSALAQLALGQAITVETLAAVLIHPEGGLKSVPLQCRRAVLLTQADTSELQACGQELSRQLLARFATVILASWQPLGNTMIEPNNGPVSEIHAVYERAGAIVLAAGGAARFGQPKQLLPWQGETLVHRVARTALEAGASPVIVVTGAWGDDVSQAVRDLPVQVAHNPDWQTGQASSVRTGVQALPTECGAAIFLLADQPQIPSTLVRSLLDQHTHTLAPIVAPLVDGRRGNPVCFDRVIFPELLYLSGDTGGRALFSRYPVIYFPWHDADALFDVDTREDYQRLGDHAQET